MTEQTADKAAPADNSVLAQIGRTSEHLRQLCEMYQVETVADKMRTADLKTLAMIHQQLNELTDHIDESRKMLSKTYDWLRHSLMIDKMDEAGLEAFSVPGVGRVYIQSSLNASIKAGAKGGAYLWLQDHGHGNLIQETVNASSLKALARTKLADNDPLPAELFNVSPKQFAVIQKK